MTGKILGVGAISGADGERYYYDDGEIKNIREGQRIDGCEVDFDTKEGKAINIYITKTSFNVDDATQKLPSNDLQSIRLKAFIMIGLFVLAIIFSAIPFINFVFMPLLGIATIVVYIFVVLGLHRASQSTTLLKNWLISFGVYILGFIFIGISVIVGKVSILGGAMNGEGMFAGFGIGATLIFVLGFIVMLSSWYFTYLYYKEVAYITNELFFMYYFWCALVGSATALFIGGLILIASAVLWIMAWVKAQEIRKSYSAL